MDRTIIALAALLMSGAATARQLAPATARTTAVGEATEAALAARGFVATLDDPRIRDANGAVVMDLSAWDFAAGPAPATATADASLWRHAGLLRRHGLFRVADRIWQVRGFDVSVMTVIRGDTGLIVVDPLTTAEVAAAALELARAHIGPLPVRGVIYTHSHVDHFGGVKGVVDPADVADGRVAIVAPAGFMDHAVAENLTAGPAMSRRAVYQFGASLPPGPAGQIGAGIGMAIARGRITLIAPTRDIARTGETLALDGVRFEFQVTPGTEAPAEMNFLLPDMAALCLAENASVTMHNILPPRGALVRDAKAWAGYLTESLTLFGGRADLLFGTHGWPRWGREAVGDYVASQRDAYQFLHDQSVRLMNRGLTAPEIAETIALPPGLAERPFNHGYYGTLRHNSRAVYQRYLGWYDGNPANLNPWPPEQAGRRYVAAMGGAAAARRIAAAALAAGDHRWAAEVASRLVFADAADAASRELLAQALERMGRTAESMVWRNIYLTGAAEARVTPTASPAPTLALDLIAATSTPQLFDLMAIRVDPDKAAGKDLSVAFVFPERRERIRVTLRNAVLLHAVSDAAVQASVTLPRAAFLGMLLGQMPASRLLADGSMTIDGDPTVLAALVTSFDAAGPTPPFPIVTL